tara:strand:- start:779 stop:1477 length:699 start_codon:yes stop_codon:yes gene_type:complete
MSIAGETIDYGPCAFMDIYDPKTVFSSIDRMGRYAYCNQPLITKWNLSRFAECLVPLIDKDQNRSVKLATEIINTFEKKYEEKWLSMMRSKLGFFNIEEKDKYLILDLLTWMHKKKVDYTNIFCHLMDLQPEQKGVYKDEDFLSWKKKWKYRMLKYNNIIEKSMNLMRNNNPLVIPRNHKVEEVLKSAEQDNLTHLKKLLTILNNPYKKQKNIKDYQSPQPSEKKYQTFCGT